MNLASCECCGIVYDKQRIPIPNIYEDDDYCVIDTSKAKWDGDTHQAIFKCPNCLLEILYETGDKA